MPRATGPAADAATPASAEAAESSATDPTAPLEEAPLPPWGRWRYVGAQGGRVYTNVPLTCHGGEVIAWPTEPAPDGCWQPTTDPVNALPDNEPRTTQVEEG
jgi:hypothetical protein